METKDAGSVLDTSFLERYNLLQKSGALDDLSMLRKENRELDMLVNDAAALVALEDVEEMIGFVISRLLERFIPGFLLYVIESTTGALSRQYCFENMNKVDRRVEQSSYEFLKAGLSDSSYPLSREEPETRSDEIPEELALLDPERFFPMRGIQGMYGVVVLGRKVVGEAYTDLEIMYVDRLIRFLSIGIQNTLHHQSSITDAKTGLYNNRYFTRRLEEEIGRSRRNGCSTGLIMIDVDHFKRFNDTWGHLAGDEVLKFMAATLKESVRSNDIPARFGGEEFCVLLIECDEAKLMEVAERIRTSVEALRVPFGPEELSVTISLGACIIDATTPGAVEDFIERADRALYRSKKGGRNRASLHRNGLFERALEYAPEGGSA